MRVGIIGLGYVGLPLARAFSDRGIAVLGFDVDPAKVARLERGESYIGHISDARFGQMRERRFEATVDFQRLDEPDVIIICVPTPLTDAREPDLTYIVNSAEAIAERLRPGQLVVLESTTYPGTTREVVLPLLAAKGLEPGVDFFLAFSPEREDPGNPQFSAPTIPKVVGGLEPASLELAVALYSKVVVQVVPVSSPEVAEACKILENTYRAINIALVNELKIIYSQMGIDVWEVIEAAKSKPFGFQAFYPGPGLGGHCIPDRPVLSHLGGPQARPDHAVHRAGRRDQHVHARVCRQQGRRCPQRPGQADQGKQDHPAGHGLQEGRGRPARVARLRADGAAAGERGGGRIQRPPHPHPAVDAPLSPPPHVQPGTDRDIPPESRDCVLIVTDHSAYDWNWIAQHAPLIVDTRNATKNVVAPERDDCPAEPSRSGITRRSVNEQIANLYW